MKESIFRAYDIRGTVGKNFSLDSVYDLGCAIAYFFSTDYPQVRSIIVGQDPRVHSEFIKRELIKAFLDSGFSIFDNGLSTSPLIYFALHTHAIDAGVMVTASHNGKEDNGIKINIGKRALTSKEIQCIKSYFFEKKAIKSSATGTVTPLSVHDSYIAYLAKQFSHLIDHKASCVIDCGNGAAGIVIQKLIQKMRWSNVRVLHAEPDGNFPNHDPDPTHSENMADVAACLLREDYEWGIGIDGDADRMAVMTKKGKLLSGDIVLALFAKGGCNQKSTILCNVLASDVILSQLKKEGITVYTVPVGNPIMRAMMCEKNAQIGGETSGHFFFSDRYFGFDDGIYAMMRFFELCVAKERFVEESLKAFPLTYVSPEFRVACPEEEKEEVIEQVKKYFQQSSPLCIDGVRVCFDHGWLLVRPSNTQAVLSIRFEATNQKEFAALQNQITHALPMKMRQEFLQSCRNAGIDF